MVPRGPWRHAFVFLTLASAILVVSILLRITWLENQKADAGWEARLIYVTVVFGGFLALASLGAVVLRLYVSPILIHAAARQRMGTRKG